MNRPTIIIGIITTFVLLLLVVWSIYIIRNPLDRDIWETLPIRPDGVQCYKWLSTQEIVCEER